MLPAVDLQEPSEEFSSQFLTCVFSESFFSDVNTSSLRSMPAEVICRLVLQHKRIPLVADAVYCQIDVMYNYWHLEHYIDTKSAYMEASYFHCCPTSKIQLLVAVEQKI